MLKGSGIWLVITRVHYMCVCVGGGGGGVRHTKIMYKESCWQNPRDKIFGSLYRQVRYIRDSLYPGSLYRDPTVF